MWPPLPYNEGAAGNIDQVTNEEIIADAKKLKAKKALDPDGISNVALKTMIQAFPNLFRIVQQKCLDEGYSHEDRKTVWRTSIV